MEYFEKKVEHRVSESKITMWPREVSCSVAQQKCASFNKDSSHGHIYDRANYPWTKEAPSTRAKLNINLSDTPACQTCHQTKHAPYYMRVASLWSDIKRLSINWLWMREENKPHLTTPACVVEPVPHSKNSGMLYALFSSCITIRILRRQLTGPWVAFVRLFVSGYKPLRESSPFSR